MAVTAAAAFMVFGGVALADPSAPAGRSKQDIFNDGQAAYEAQDWGKAITDFSAVLSDVQNDNRSDAIIRTRLADSLLNVGRLEEAHTQATRAVAT
ncbi:MAG TPA: hypothetical protein VII42_10105, partial [Caulobacteraceae bacterium]